MSGAVDLGAPWILASSPDSTMPAPRPGSLARRVSDVPWDVLPGIRKEGLTAAPVDGLRRLLVPAQGWLGAVPDLERLVLDVVGHVHPLASKPGYDLSHSQPRWQDRVFVSCPERADDIGALRLIEAVVHEAMHLHLTNEERREPLVATWSGTAHSPWRDACRPVQGVLHGYFVFACISRFLAMVAHTFPLAGHVGAYVSGRLDTIGGELGRVDTAELSLHLTSRGRAAVESWVAHGRTEGARCTRSDHGGEGATPKDVTITDS